MRLVYVLTYGHYIAHYQPDGACGAGWYFYMPAEHGPPEHQREWGSIPVGPYLTKDACQRQASATQDACIAHHGV